MWRRCYEKCGQHKAKLRQLAIAEGKPFDYLLMHYFIERLLYRLSISRYQLQFVLKGGLLLYTILENDARATKDIDFLARQLANTPEAMMSVFRQICAIEADDAIRFDLDSIAASRIKEDADYEGVRIKVVCYLDKGRHALRFDIGFGDVVVPKPMTMRYPSLLDMERPQLQAYSCESIVAEKFEAMLALAEVNSRMKDFYDIYTLSRMFHFDGAVLREAISQTVTRRGTPLPEMPTVFTKGFSVEKSKQMQWAAFQKRINVAGGLDFSQVTLAIYDFLQPVYQSIYEDSEWGQFWNHKEMRWEFNLV